MSEHDIRFVRRRVIEQGCNLCRDLLAYTVVSGGVEVGEVRMVRLRDGHPEGEHHYGVDWEGVLPDGTRARGWYGTQGAGERDVFITRWRAGQALTAMAT